VTVESNENFLVNLSNASNATIADSQGSGIILNDDTPPVVPAISIDDVTHTEGNSGTTAYTFTVSLDQATTNTVTVDFSTANGSATIADADYRAASGSLTFNPGETSHTITILVNGDVTVESNENFLVNLSNAANATIADGQGSGIILNDDAAPVTPAISINDVKQAEGDSGTTAFTFTVSLDQATTNTVTVDYNSTDGTATLADNDYQLASGTLTFNPGETSHTITVLVNGDTTFEPDENFFINLSN
jgi:Calx-beta domain